MEVIPATLIPNAVWAKNRAVPFWYLMRKGEYLVSPGTYVYKVLCRGEPSEDALSQMHVQEIKYLMGEEPWR